mmetsp:Transcript_22518/g.55750  ORF Transcript_22518/g.55750 Transcript_22518/m.55750 type:complete len:251 (+) Transcript_22518:81-833(+)
MLCRICGPFTYTCTLHVYATIRTVDGKRLGLASYLSSEDLSSHSFGYCIYYYILLLHFLNNCYKDDEEFVTCGSAIKLSHYESKAQTRQEHFLNSEGKNLGSGSGQQIVTAVTNPTTTNTLWWIRQPNDPESRINEISACKSGKPAEKIQCGSILRLTHLNSMRNLHSHDVRSPLSRQQEVSAYGQGDGMGDNGDDWKLICNSGHWKREEMFQLQHLDSKRYLGASSTVKVQIIRFFVLFVCFNVDILKF